METETLIPATSVTHGIVGAPDAVTFAQPAVSALQNVSNPVPQNAALVSHVTEQTDDSLESLLQALETRVSALEAEVSDALKSRLSKLETFVQKLFHPSEWGK
jgi:hypothetical protein